nr:hypothetical protein [Haladaptatus halobius]
MLFINLEESEDDVRANAAAVDIDLSDVHFLDLSSDSDVFTEEQSYDIFAPNEVEQEPLTQAITNRVESLDRSATEFADAVRQEVEANDTSIVMIDGIDGYKLSLRDDDERMLIRKLHTLCRYLKNAGVTVSSSTKSTLSQVNFRRSRPESATSPTTSSSSATSKRRARCGRPSAF